MKIETMLRRLSNPDLLAYAAEVGAMSAGYFELPAALADVARLDGDLKLVSRNAALNKTERRIRRDELRDQIAIAQEAVSEARQDLIVAIPITLDETADDWDPDQVSDIEDVWNLEALQA